MNVAINAVQAMPDGGTLILRTRSDGESSVILEVEDSGSGMTAEVRARAMDPFFTTKPVGEGSGLGLAIVYGTMKAHGGSVAIQSMPGRGTLVTMTLPAMTNPPPLAEPLPASSRTMASALEILVVDDDTLVQEVMGGLLELLGHLPRVVDSGPAALVYLEQAGAPDVVILDINMPGMDGLTTVGRIWALAPKLPVLIVSGRVESSALDLALEHPNVGFLSKPVTLDELKAALDQLLEPPIPLG
jgi:CheY-like chemotaxis protein